MTSSTLLAFIGPIGWPEMLIIGLIGVLIFGKRLPEVGKSIGKGIVEFKKGLSGVDDDVENAVKQQKSIEDKPADTTTVDTGTQAHSNAGPSTQS